MRDPPRSTRTAPLCPNPTLFRSCHCPPPASRRSRTRLLPLPRMEPPRVVPSRLAGPITGIRRHAGVSSRIDAMSQEIEKAREKRSILHPRSEKVPGAEGKALQAAKQKGTIRYPRKRQKKTHGG